MLRLHHAIRLRLFRGTGEDRNKILLIVIAILLAVPAYGLIACNQSAYMVVTEDNPPIIKLSGNALFDRLEVRGPLPERMDDKEPLVKWKLVPPSSPPSLSDLPPITYGMAPDQLVQVEPKIGAPPALIEGKIYNIEVITRGPNHTSKTIVIRNGKAQEMTERDYVVDNRNISFVPTDLRNLNSTGRIYFVPVMNYSGAVLTELAKQTKQKYGLNVEIKPNLSTNFSTTYDVQTGKHIAEEIIEELKRAYPSSSSQEHTIYIAFLPQDMYIKRENSRFAYVYSEDRYAAISDARLRMFADDGMEKARLRKLLNRVIGAQYYKLPFSENKGSVLFKVLLGPDDLDRMSEDF
jgi:predicted Zn-dependent protease